MEFRETGSVYLANFVLTSRHNLGRVIRISLRMPEAFGRAAERNWNSFKPLKLI